VYRVDVVGSFNVVKAFLQNLTPHGSIVFTASTPALVGDTYGIPYAAAKGALIALTRSVAKALAPIRVNAVAFGPVATRWVGWISESELEVFKERTVLKRLATPREAAEAIYWLLSPASSYVTGHVLVVDGGESL
ncbi:MAG: SDR family NAD(P)-dependent oxidoreductase, partial [Pyrobaculum sp.]